MGVEEIQKINCYIGGIIVKIKTKDYIICGNYGQGRESNYKLSGVKKL